MNAVVPLAVNQLARVHTAQEWACLISDAVRDSAAAIIRVGQLLVQAKLSLSHGEFGEMIDSQLPFGRRTAQMLMAIASDERLSNTNHASLLPPSWTTLYELTRLDDETFRARVDDGTIRPDMERGEAREGRLTSRREHRVEVMRELAANPLRLPQGPFLAGIVDPPWINPDAPIGFTDRHYANKYPLMTPAEIAALPVADIFAPVALLALWITDHHLINASHIAVLEAWRFTAKALITWDKEWPGLGMGYVRNVTEHVILATRGNPPVPPPDRRPNSLFHVKRSTKHSEKPAQIHEWIESWFGSPEESPYVELFARGEGRAGWAAFGNEAATVSPRPQEKPKAALGFWT